MVNDRIIKAIHVVDKKNDGSGATAKIENGGIGARSATIKLTSQRGGDIKNIVLIYVY